MNRGDKTFDPYPYILLNLFLTVISTFQSPLIMMSQNRQMERDREAVAGLHAKLDALAERLAMPKDRDQAIIDWATAKEIERVLKNAPLPEQRAHRT